MPTKNTTDHPSGEVVNLHPTRKNIYQRMNAVMQEVSYIQKEKKTGMRYSIVTHDVVTAKVRPALVQHGIVYFPSALEMKQTGNRTECVMTIRFQNIDDPSDFMQVPSAGYGIDDQDKGPGKAISYAVKYALLKALGLESGDDPDEDQVTPHSNASLVASFQLEIDDATSTEVLRTIRSQVIAAHGEGKLSQAEAQGLVTSIKQAAAKLPA